MKLPRNADASDLIEALARLRYRVVRQSGSHVRLQCDDPAHAVTVPNHRPLRIGTLAAIIADVAAKHGIEKDVLVKLLSL